MKTIVWFGFVLGALSAAGNVILTKPGQKATIKCGVSSYNSYLKWNHGSELIIHVPKRTFPRKGTSGTAVRSRVAGETDLVISPVTGEDAGKFTCETDGSKKDHTLLVASVSARPSAELQLGSNAELKCQVRGLNPDPTVQWKRPDGSSHSGSPTVDLNPVTDSDNGTWKCTFSHDGETYSNDLVIKVQEPAPKTSPTSPSRGPDGNHKPNCSSCNTKPPPDAALLLGLSWWMWTAVGAGGLVVILLTVLVIVLCKRNKRRKKRILKMKNSRQPLMPKTYCQCDRPAAAAKPQQGRRREKPSAPPLPPLLMQ